MASANMDENMSSTNHDSDINILLLGETGVGKSTFINSFVNYLQYMTFNNAMNSKLECLIPLKFTVPNENFEDRIIEFGSDENEDSRLGNSSTQGTKGYNFQFENYNIRLIDTPGIGDARGVEQDGKNFENVLSYISQYKHLHGICFLLKPNVSVINAYFKFCIVHLLSRLEKSAANNIIFIFTNSRSTFYRPGETLPLLKRILNEVKESPPHVEIPCEKRNMFCVDNEAFKFLIATKHGINFEKSQTKEFAMSWKNSYKTCVEILSYICGDKHNDPLLPHEIQNTISVNEARRIIVDLSKPLADVSDLIQDNITLLKRHETCIQQENLSKKELSGKLYVPTVELKVAELSQPVTVCTASKCSEIYTCGELNKYHYKQRCHNPCYLPNVPKEIIGTPELINCAAMDGGTKCIHCKCDYSVHMHIYYESQVVQSKQEDVSIKKRIKTKEDEIQAKTRIIAKLNKKSAEYEHEKEQISKSMAKFAHFLKENSISAYNDAYLDYLDYLIEREKLLGSKKDKARINHYTSLKKQYEHEKKILDNIIIKARQYNKNAKIVRPSEVLALVQKLYKLKHTGAEIAKLHSIQQKSVQQSVSSKEYKHPMLMKKNQPESDPSDEDEDEETQSINVIKSMMLGKPLKEKELKIIKKQQSHLSNIKAAFCNYLIPATDTKTPKKKSSSDWFSSDESCKTEHENGSLKASTENSKFSKGKSVQKNKSTNQDLEDFDTNYTKQCQAMQDLGLDVPLTDNKEVSDTDDECELEKSSGPAKKKGDGNKLQHERSEDSDEYSTDTSDESSMVIEKQEKSSKKAFVLIEKPNISQSTVVKKDLGKKGPN